MLAARGWCAGRARLSPAADHRRPREEPPVLARFLRRVTATGRAAVQARRRGLLAATRPAAPALIVGALADRARRKPGLVAENASLRQQLLLLRRSVKRPRCTPAGRALLVFLASRVRAWRSALLIAQPATLLRWHRQLSRQSWRRKSRSAAMARRPKIAADTIALIREMAATNPLRGAERIRGELLQLDLRAAKWTVRKHIRDARPPRRSGQTRATCLRNHATDIRACDSLPIAAVLFRPPYAFVVLALGSRRVVHVGATRHPTDARVAQRLREATPFGQRPRHLIRDNDAKYGQAFARVAAVTGMAELRTACRAPGQNALGERFLGSVRRECLDHLLVLGEAHLRRVLREDAGHFNAGRPHQGLQQRIPDRAEGSGHLPQAGEGASCGGAGWATPPLPARGMSHGTGHADEATSQDSGRTGEAAMRRMVGSVELVPDELFTPYTMRSSGGPETISGVARDGVLRAGALLDRVAVEAAGAPVQITIPASSSIPGPPALARATPAPGPAR
jgi:putative transposase